MIKRLKPHHKRIVVDSLGWIFILLGLVGLVLPFLQGILFVMLGFYLLSLHSLWFHQKLHDFKVRFPRLGSHIESLDTKVRAFLGLEIDHPRS